MKLFHWLVTLPLAIILIIFAVANRETVALTFWPLPISVEAPVYLIVLLTLLVGFLIGELVAWLNGHRWRRQARHLARRVEELERERTAQAVAPVTPNPAKIPPAQLPARKVAETQPH